MGIVQPELNFRWRIAIIQAVFLVVAFVIRIDNLGREFGGFGEPLPHPPGVSPSQIPSLAPYWIPPRMHPCLIPYAIIAACFGLEIILCGITISRDSHLRSIFYWLVRITIKWFPIILLIAFIEIDSAHHRGAAMPQWLAKKQISLEFCLFALGILFIDYAWALFYSMPMHNYVARLIHRKNECGRGFAVHP